MTLEEFKNLKIGDKICCHQTQHYYIVIIGYHKSGKNYYVGTKEVGDIWNFYIQDVDAQSYKIIKKYKKKIG